MTQDAQRIAIAQACGITGYLHDLPDYLNDLNAMHEVEMILPIWLDDGVQPYQGTRHHYRHELCLLCSQPIHATAAHRAEAFLRALKLWRDDA